MRIVAEDISYSPDPRTELAKSYGIQAYACHPLIAQGRLMGTFSFGTRTRSRFSDQDLARMQGLIDSLLDYSRVTSRAMPFSEVDLSEAAGEESQIRGKRFFGNHG